MIQAYDFLLVVGILAALGTISFEIKALIDKGETRRRHSNIIKPIAFLGILCMVTAIVSGTVITGYVTQDSVGGGLDTAAQKMKENNGELFNIKKDILSLKESINDFKIDSFSNTFEGKDALIKLIDRLEEKIDDLLDSNEDLEDDIDDLKDDIKDIYAFLPGGFY